MLLQNFSEIQQYSLNTPLSPLIFLHQKQLSILYNCNLPNTETIFSFLLTIQKLFILTIISAMKSVLRLLNQCECNANTVKTFLLLSRLGFKKLLHQLPLKLHQIHIAGISWDVQEQDGTCRRHKQQTLHENDLQGHPGSPAVVWMFIIQPSTTHRIF